MRSVICLKVRGDGGGDGDGMETILFGSGVANDKMGIGQFIKNIGYQHSGSYFRFLMSLLMSRAQPLEYDTKS